MMPEKLAAVLELIEPSNVAVDPQEMKLRDAAVAKLCERFRESDARVASGLVADTLAIPVFWLALAVRLTIEARVYPSLPTAGDLWRVAKEAAGMSREQYHAGRYLPPPRGWPPGMSRHAIQAGELEAVRLGPGAVERLAPGAVAQIAAESEGRESG